MVTVPKPDTETKRLELLNIIELLGRSNQSLLDQLTRLAASVFNTPIALALIIDKDQHWLTCNRGLPEQAPISDLPFHAYTLRQEHVLVVEDTLISFADNAMYEAKRHGKGRVVVDTESKLT